MRPICRWSATTSVSAPPERWWRPTRWRKSSTPLVNQAILLVDEFEASHFVLAEIKNPILAQSLHLRVGILAQSATGSSPNEVIPNGGIGLGVPEGQGVIERAFLAAAMASGVEC